METESQTPKNCRICGASYEEMDREWERREENSPRPSTRHQCDRVLCPKTGKSHIFLRPAQVLGDDVVRRAGYDPSEAEFRMCLYCGAIKLEGIDGLW